MHREVRINLQGTPGTGTRSPIDFPPCTRRTIREINIQLLAAATVKRVTNGVYLIKTSVACGVLAIEFYIPYRVSSLPAPRIDSELNNPTANGRLL